MLKNQYLKFLLMTMAAIAAVDYVQTKIMRIPLIGDYLPGGIDKPLK